MDIARTSQINTYYTVKNRVDGVICMLYQGGRQYTADSYYCRNTVSVREHEIMSNNFQFFNLKRPYYIYTVNISKTK